MSSPGHEAENADRIDFPKVIAVGVVSLIVFALSTWWAISILHSERDHLEVRGVAGYPTEVGKPEIGIVDQVPFQGDNRLEVWKKDQQERLNGYGWSNRKRGLIHIPIEQAMTEIAAGASPGPSPVSGGGEK